MARLQELYSKEVVKKLQKQFGFESAMEVPRFTKITLNMGVGEAMDDKKIVTAAVADLETIAIPMPFNTFGNVSQRL